MFHLYLDNNATTPLLPAVWEAMRPLLTDAFGNAASPHQFGRRARQALETSRERLAALLDASPDEVIFTSGATEANNLALFGFAGSPPGHIVTSPVEHPSVSEPVRRLAEAGFAVSTLPVDEKGVVREGELEELLRPETRLVTVQMANHETGAVQPIRSITTPGESQAAFHCDAVQAVGKIPVRFHELGVTSLSLSAHKFHGPPGIGALLLRRGTRIPPLFWGGHQQQGRRPGTEPVALVVGLVTALEIALREREMRHERVRHLRRRFLDGLGAAAGPVVQNGPAEGGVPHTLNLSFPGCPADALLMSLDLAGVACSTGSACSSGSLLPSPVLAAMGVSTDRLHSALRFSLSFLLSEEEVDEAVRRISKSVHHLRKANSSSEHPV